MSLDLSAIPIAVYYLLILGGVGLSVYGVVNIVMDDKQKLK